MIVEWAIIRFPTTQSEQPPTDAAGNDWLHFGYNAGLLGVLRRDLQVFPNDPWMASGNSQQRNGRAFKPTSVLLPVAKSVHADPQNQPLHISYSLAIIHR